MIQLFFSGNTHGVVDVGEDGRFDEIAGAVNQHLPSAAGQFCAFIDTDFDIFHDASGLLFIDDGAGATGWIKRIAGPASDSMEANFFNQLIN